MNIADQEKVANRKRLNAEAEKLPELVNRDTANIIKFKVSQDTTCWDLKQKLHQLKNRENERLQQNMVEVQMQHEAISGQYQDELRLRPETLNKLNSTCEIKRRASVSRCKVDQAMLAEAFNKSGEIVKENKEKQSQSEKKNVQLINNLQEKVKLLAEHKEQMAQVFNTSKQHLDSELNDARSKLATALSHKDELIVALNYCSRKLDHTKRELEKKNENIVCLQTGMKKYIYECENQLAEMKNAKSVQEKELKECMASKEVLKTALQNQEQLTQSICDQNNKLQEEISGLEEEHILNSENVKGLASKLDACLIYTYTSTYMHNLFDNLEKEVTTTPSATGAPRDVADQDHNAAMRNPTPINKRVVAPPPRKIQQISGFVAPNERSQRHKEPDNILQHLFSDSDAENELLADPAQINRHFEAVTRGERVSPWSYKRRIPGPDAHNVQPSLSQIDEAKANKRSDNKAKKPKND